MPFKFYAIVGLIILSTSKLSSQITWNVWKVEIYNLSTKKTQTDSIHSGSLYLNTDNKLFSVSYNNRQDLFSFNSATSNIPSDSFFLSYYFKYYNLPATDRIAYLTYLYDKDGKWSGGRLSIESGGIETSYYINKPDSTIDDNTFTKHVIKEVEGLKFEWSYVTTASKGDIFFMRSEVVKNNTGYIKVWVKDLLKTYKYKGVTYSNVEAKALMTFDCDNNRIMTDETIYYNSKKEVITSTNDYYMWQNVVPESMGEILIKKACGLFKK